jgi:hypothetical protein
MGARQMKLIKSSEIADKLNSRFLVFGIQIALSILLIKHFDSERSDFRLFYNSAQELVAGISPWDINIHEFGNAYLNDPITLWFLVPLTSTSYEVALLVFRVINVLLALLMLNTLLRNQRLPIILIGSVFLLTSVTIRANLEYGALGFLAFVVWLSAINLIRKNHQLVLAGALLAYTSMFKPQLYFINIVFLIVGSWKIRLSFIATIGVSIGATSLVIQKFVLIDWISAIKLRAEIAQTDNLQMDFACLLRILGLDESLAISAYIVMVLVILFVIVRTRITKLVLGSPETMLMLATSLSIFLHPTDLSIAAFVVLTMFILRQEISLAGLFAISLLNVWSNNPAFSIISGLVIFVLYLLLSDRSTRKHTIGAAIIAGIPLSFAIFSTYLPNSENFLRNASNYLGLFLLMILILTQLAQSRAVEKEKQVS